MSGLYLAHPKARYFNVGPIGRDQVASYAARKGLPAAEVEKLVTSSLPKNTMGLVTNSTVNGYNWRFCHSERQRRISCVR